MHYTEQQLLSLVSEIEKEFSVELKKAEGEAAAPLAKSEPSAEVVKSETTAIEKNEDCDYDEEDKKAMHKMYKSMSKGELKAHHESIAKAMTDGDLAKADGNGGEMNACPPKGSPGAKSEASETPQPVLNKTETGKIEANPPKGSPGAKSSDSETPQPVLNKAEIEKCPPKGSPGAKSADSETPQPVLNKGSEMNKSEADLLKSEIESLKKENEDSKNQLNAVTAFLTKFVEKTTPPPQKAITSIDVIAKGEGAGAEVQPLTKSEITPILLKKSADPTLAKADRDAINEFYLNGADIKTISHLLK
jgi:hypothetical protein